MPILFFSEEIFIPYDASALPQSYAALKHPGDIVEAGSLAVRKTLNSDIHCISNLIFNFLPL